MRGVEAEGRELSFAQQSFWFLEQLLPGAAFSNISVGWRLRGRLDERALEGALSAVVARHAVLRTRFVNRGGQPVALVDPGGWTGFRVVDAGDRPSSWGRLAGEEASRPFDLGRGPLLRALLLRLAETDRVLVVTVHHIAGDFQSVGLLRSELSALYGSLVEGREPDVAPLPAQYADHAARQRRGLAGEALARQLDHWRRRLAGAPEVLELAAGRTRPALRSYRGRRLEFAVPDGVAGGLRELARRSRATLFMALLAAFQVLLARHAGQEDLLVATQISTRPRGMEGVIGPFLNTLVLRADLAGEPAFRELLARVRSLALEAYARRDLPYEQLLAALRPERSPDRNPLAQVFFQLLDTRAGQLELAGLEVEGLGALGETMTRYDLELHLFESSDRLWGRVVYSADLFAGEAVERLADHYQALLASVVAAPDVPIWGLEWLPEVERRPSWGGERTGAGGPTGSCLHELFEAQARRTPGSEAVVAAGRALTYDELDRRADLLAGRLRGLGVGPETLVGVCLDRSPDLVVGLLAVLKAGGAYVPLDLEQPAGRLAFIAADAGCRVLLTQSHLTASLPATDATVVRLDAPGAERPEAAGAAAPARVRPEGTAYLMYTSGSTGAPKGVRVPHRALVNFLVSMRERPGLGPRDSLLAVTTAAFDIAALELFLPLVCGARVVIAGRETARDGALLGAALDEAGATVLQATPATWQMLLASGWRGRRGLRMLCGGETLTPALAAGLLERGGALWNLYGPTETAVWSTVQEVERAEGRIAVGEPIADTAVLVLDRRLRPVPTGAAGELCIGGAGLAHGYHARAGLTAERFVPFPGGPPGARLYRTGDLGRRLPSGALEHLGRMDHQVKVRGFRVELGEIEACLGEHPAVREAAVVQREDGPGRRLVAYVAGGGPLTVSDLQAHVRARLPDHMVPARLVQLDRLPRTANGKIDRRGLPVPDPGRPLLQAPFIRPRTATEERVAAIWGELLGLSRVGVDDDFFQLGGDSMLAVWMAARVSIELGVVVPVLAVFEHPTVAALVGAASDVFPAPPASEPARETVVTEPLPGQRWVFDRMRPDHCCMTAMFEVPAGVDLDVVGRAFDALLGHHDALRARFARTGGGWRQVIPAAVDRTVTVGSVDLSSLPPDARRVELEARGAALQAGIDYERGPALRVVHFDLGPAAPGRLLVLISHLLVDGYSAAIVYDDLETAHRQLRAGEPVSLPPRTTSFGEYAGEVAAFARSEERAPEVRYWLGLPWASVARLPVDLPPDLGGNTYASERGETVALSREETALLLHDAPRLTGAEVGDVLLAAMVQTVAAWAGSPVAHVVVVGHRRNVAFDSRANLSRTVGFVGHGHPELLVAGPLDTPLAAVAAIARQRRTIPRRGFGFEVLRELGQPHVRRSLRALPAHPLVFNYLGDLKLTRPYGPERSLLLRPARERVPAVRPVSYPEVDRLSLLEYEAAVADGRFRLEIKYSENRHLSATVSRLAGDYAAWLRRLIELCAPER